MSEAAAPSEMPPESVVAPTVLGPDEPPVAAGIVTHVDFTVRRSAPDAGRLRRATKRAMDVVGSIVLLALLLPIGLLVALAIAVDSRGPVLYVQRRVGRHGIPFSLVKFRTMITDGEAVLARALASDDALRDEWERTRKLRDDPRVTRVGRVLRRLSLDELPQVLNVLIGAMSLVGPRPVMEDELRYFGERARAVLAVRPGLTGLWAVSGRSDISYEERVELEHEYATRWTILGDIGILLRTLPAVVRGHGAF